MALCPLCPYPHSSPLHYHQINLSKTDMVATLRNIPWLQRAFKMWPFLSSLIYYNLFHLMYSIFSFTRWQYLPFPLCTFKILCLCWGKSLPRIQHGEILLLSSKLQLNHLFCVSFTDLICSNCPLTSQ